MNCPFCCHPRSFKDVKVVWYNKSGHGVMMYNAECECGSSYATTEKLKIENEGPQEKYYMNKAVSSKMKKARARVEEKNSLKLIDILNKQQASIDLLFERMNNIAEEMTYMREIIKTIENAQLK